MKNNYLIFLALLPFFMNAQLEIDTDWNTEINNIFQYLDKSKVTSGHLLDYAPASDDPDDFRERGMHFYRYYRL